jgi:cytochrome P450
MELPLPLSTALALTITFVALVLSSVVWHRRRSHRKALNLPPGPRGWPVFGSLGLLADALPPHHVLAKLAARHGPLMHLRLGSFHVVVASSEETARLVLQAHDLAFADRPPTAFGEILGYGYQGIVQTPYGPYWRMARKLCATELFSARRVDAFERARAQEMRALTRGVFERAGAIVEVKEHLLNFTMRNIVRMALGEKWSPPGGRSSEGDEAFRRSLKESFTATGLLGNVGEWVPWLGWLDVQGCVRRMKRVHVLFDQFNEQILHEHQKDRRRRRAAAAGMDDDMDLVDVLLQLAEDGEEEPTETRLTRDGVKAFLLDIIGGGTETAAATIEWAILELLRHPNATEAATEELDRVVGRGRWVTERDLPELPYVEAVVKETMRLHPVGPLLIPHHAREDTVVGGYDVPAGTRLLVNTWAVGRDPASWPDEPDAFRPERFLAEGSGEGVDVRGTHFRLLPFGSGRRMCPAYNLAMKEMVAAMANLVHGFSWRLPDGVAPGDLSMEEFFGLNVSRKEPLRAVAEPRLPAHLYAAVD